MLELFYKSRKTISQQAALWAMRVCLVWFFVAGIVQSAPQVSSVGAGATDQTDAAKQIALIENAQSPYRQGFDALTIPELMKVLNVPGVSIAVIRDFRIHWAKAYGTSDAQTGLPVKVDTLFQAASISKPVTAMAALHLVQEGRLSLDGDVNGILKSWRVPVKNTEKFGLVTPRSLFSHTSGADDGFGFPGYSPGAPLPTAEQILNGEAPSNTGPVVFTRPVYGAYKYSGGGLTIMRLLLTTLMEEPFERIMQTEVLQPLGMRNSTFQQPLLGVLAEHAARAHDDDGHRTSDPWHVYPELAPDGLWTTPSDLALVAIELQRALRGPSGTFLTEASGREMVAPVGVGPYAVGFEVSKRGEGWYFSHGGSNWGFECHLLAHVRKGYGVVIMTNGGNAVPLITEIESRVAAAYHWDTLDRPLFRQ
jgi:CubicO group peptidase (beta-lactamase class C family)